ncbi:MAG: mechanosensitive ion channel, partial [Anaerolineales bacterium]|nr:mechanosensitive ion channel [Anaerolineales bacterium]
VDVQPVAQDEQIDRRLTRILEATEWFVEPQVMVEEGVVFLEGDTTTEEYRTWAGNLARNTQDVVAVVNRIEVLPRPAWDFTPALDEIRLLWRGAIRAVPLLVFGVVMLLLAWWLTRMAARLLKRFFQKRLRSPLLVNLASYIVSTPIFLVGLYIVLQVSGLTRLALTVLGGTGIVGIALGFAFQDITENFLASVLLSLRHPFKSKDLIEVAGYMGIVQQMNTRSTVLMTIDGNHIQIPNATIFKNTIINYTANPNRRADFTVGIGYEDSILEAQELVAQVLKEHPAVLNEPEPLVLAEELGAATVNLRIYFWYDASLYAPVKIKSSLIRLTKRTLDEAGVSMPDEAREVIFPQGVPLVQIEQTGKRPPRPTKESDVPPKRPEPAEPISNLAEGDLKSEEADIENQAAHSRNPEEGENLLDQP